jgi:hypothetical protein
MYQTIPSIITGVLRGLADLPNKEWEINIEIIKVSVKVTIRHIEPTGKRAPGAYTVIHAPEYPVSYAERGGYERAQRLIRHVEQLAALRRAA